MGGKVLVSTQEHIDRLVAARLAADILGVNTILVARTDAEAATLLDSNVDGRDHPFILGVTNPNCESLNDTLAEAKRQGYDLDKVSKDWTRKANMMTFSDAVLTKIKNINISEYKKQLMIQRWLASGPNNLSNAESRRVADSILGRQNSVSCSTLLWDCCLIFYSDTSSLSYYHNIAVTDLLRLGKMPCSRRILSNQTWY